MLPKGSWIHSSRNYKVIDNILFAELRDNNGNWIKNKIALDINSEYNNCNGLFNCHKINNNNLNKLFKNKWCILLTTAINVNDNQNEINYRKNLYLYQINKWLNNTNYFIYIVESTGNGNFFDNIKNKNINRINVISLKLEKSSSSSILEAISIKAAMNYILTTNEGKECTHILKVTGRYFLNNIQYVLENKNQKLDVYIQIYTNHKIKWQNTEYYGIKKELLIPMVENVIQNGDLMEKNFYSFIHNNNLTKNILGPFDNNIRRGGDKMLINKL